MNPSNPSSKGKVGTRHEPAKPVNHERKACKGGMETRINVKGQNRDNWDIERFTRQRAVACNKTHEKSNTSQTHQTPHHEQV